MKVKIKYRQFLDLKHIVNRAKDGISICKNDGKLT
jgi:hypothetical protein